MFLHIDNITKNFGGLTALEEINFIIEEGMIQAIIGPNGAGKTTLLNIISGIYEPDLGKVRFKGTEINNYSPNEIAKIGISRTFQHVELFSNMTVLENIMVGRYVRTKAGLFACGFRLPSARNEEKAIKRDSEQILEYIGLIHRRNEKASSLPIGEQRKLEIGRAIATEPTLLLLDEPASGLNEAETIELSSFIRQLREQKRITIILVEHDMRLVMDISDKIVVLDFGKMIAEGTPEEIQNNKLVIDAYLGEEDNIC
ncbi:MAG: ABC transporter ATP-binding protein [Thermodesulfovibrionales bacterium]|nr:ABC transporter ATP-binding protein [Thermodesulfovibrionales bacterium]